MVFFLVGIFWSSLVNLISLIGFLFVLIGGILFLSFFIFILLMVCFNVICVWVIWFVLVFDFWVNIWIIVLLLFVVIFVIIFVLIVLFVGFGIIDLVSGFGLMDFWLVSEVFIFCFFIFFFVYNIVRIVFNDYFCCSVYNDVIENVIIEYIFFSVVNVYM